MRSRLGLLAMLAAAAAAAASLGVAAIPGSSGLIHGCYAKSGGHLRLIDPSAGGRCKRTEKAISWNQQGVAGPAGPAGPALPTGWQIFTDGTTLAPGMSAGRQVWCDRADYAAPTGLVPVGGGYHTDADSGFVADMDYPQVDATGEGWNVFGRNPTTHSILLTVYVICVKKAP